MFLCSIRYDCILTIETSKEYCTVVFASALTHSLQSTASVTCKVIVGWQRLSALRATCLYHINSQAHIRIGSSITDYAHACISDGRLDNRQVSLKHHWQLGTADMPVRCTSMCKAWLRHEQREHVYTYLYTRNSSYKINYVRACMHPRQSADSSKCPWSDIACQRHRYVHDVALCWQQHCSLPYTQAVHRLTSVVCLSGTSQPRPWLHPGDQNKTRSHRRHTAKIYPGEWYWRPECQVQLTCQASCSVCSQMTWTPQSCLSEQHTA